MRLVFLIGRFPPGVYGGAELQAEGWARRLAKRHSLIVVTRKNRPGEPDEETRDGFKVVRLPVSTVPILRSALDVRAIERTVEAIAPRPQALLCFQTFVSGFAGVRIQQRLGIPAIVWVRGEDEYRLTGWRASRLSIGVWRKAAGVLVQSEANREAVLGLLRARARRHHDEIAMRIATVPNGLDLPGPPFVLGDRVLVVCRLIHDKGVDLVIEAVAALKGRLTIAGDGPERPRLEARARALGLDCRFEGVASRAQLDGLYREAACVVLASRRGEGLPNALLEGMAHARPIVATPVTGVRDLVTDGENGLLVAPGDAHALRDALSRVLGNRDLAGRLGAAGRTTAERFDWDAVQPRLEAALERWGRQ